MDQRGLAGIVLKVGVQYHVLPEPMRMAGPRNTMSTSVNQPGLNLPVELLVDGDDRAGAIAIRLVRRAPVATAGRGCQFSLFPALASVLIALTAKHE